jgi:DNA-binding NtrC family response regulator
LGVKTFGEFVRGPAMQQVVVEAEHAAKVGTSLHIHGESGAGKEGVARAFHAASGFASGPFVAVNCATIAQGIAERLLFGAKKGAYSGADTDTIGFFQTAERGTLFLDEIVELDLPVQAKLLRAIETREVLAVGAVDAKHIELNICSATHRSLRKLVTANKLREDLFFRIGRPEVIVPPLRDRIEEIPLLLHRAVSEHAKELHISLVEVCMLRPWPGNVRELLVEARAAAHRASLKGDARVESSHLDASGGAAFEQEPKAKIETRPQKPLDPDDRARIVAALQQCNGKVAAAARVLGIHRTQLRRLIEAHGINAED